MKISHVLCGSASVLAGALLVAACGSGPGAGSGAGGGPPTRTLDQEYPAIKAAARAATSVRMSGTVTYNGKPVSIDMAFVKPNSAAGSVAEDNTSYTIIVTPGQTYIQISKQLLRSNRLPASLCSAACGKYLAIPALPSGAFSDLSMTSLIGTLFTKPLDQSEAAMKLAAGQYAGEPAWTGSGGGETFTVARGGPPYLLSVSKDGRAITFSDWNSATVSPPPASRVLTATQLGTLAAGG
jgi:hypothetical protein